VAAGDVAAIDALVRTAAASVSANPDPGTNAYGWDEGTNLRRQQSLNCLWRASGGDSRLLPAIEATAQANMDMARYYGLPNHLPHNHGTMANLALLDAGTLLGRQLWIDTAVNRLARDSGGAWTAGGVTIEQSAPYHKENTIIWGLVADALAVQPGTTAQAATTRIRSDLVRANRALAYLTTPTGLIVPYGDGNAVEGNPQAQSPGAFRDDAAGVASGRWSWTDPNTTYYLLRYGPPRRAHGHEDRQSLVWHTWGVPVLIDPATFSYDPGSYTTYGRSTVAHNVQYVPRRSFNAAAWVSLNARSTSGSVHGYTTVDAQYGVTHTRNWRIDHGVRRVTVTDAVNASAATTLHLDQSWVMATSTSNKRTYTFTHPSGRRLTVQASSALTWYKGSTRPVLGWVFPTYGSRVHGWQLFMYPVAGTSTVVLTVS
jgi:hypothetical protein